jgi:hypothetical protein
MPSRKLSRRKSLRPNASSEFVDLSRGRPARCVRGVPVGENAREETLKKRHWGATHVLTRNDRTALTLKCPACGRATPQRFLYIKNGCDIFQCRDCGLGRTKASSFDPLAYYDGRGNPDTPGLTRS